MNPKLISESQRKIKLGDTFIELTDEEIIIGAVSYLYLPENSRTIKRLYATPEEVLQIRYPEISFQVSNDGYEFMLAKAKRLIELRNSTK